MKVWVRTFWNYIYIYIYNVQSTKFQDCQVSATHGVTCRQELTPGVNISVKVMSGDESEKQVWQWLEAGPQDLRNWSLVQLRSDMVMGCACGFRPVHQLIGHYLLSGVFCWHISFTLLHFFHGFLRKFMCNDTKNMQLLGRWVAP